MAPYRIALIGTGRVGYQFNFGDLPDNHAEAIAQNPRCQLVAGVNRGRDKLEDFGRRCQVEALYTDYRQMLDEIKPDICIVTTHPELHAEMVETTAAAPTTKGIICEKPMALSLEECDRMIAACQQGDVLLQINHNRRWNPQWIRAGQLLKEGAIGRLNTIFAFMDGAKPTPSWRSAHEGPLLHDFTHYFDLMDLYGGPVQWLCGMAEQRQRPWAVEDFTAAFMKFATGATGVIHASELTEYTETHFELRGEKGVIRVEGEKARLFQAKLEMSEPDSGFQWSSLQETSVKTDPPTSSYVVALDELLDALEGKTTLRSDGQVGRRSLELVEAVYRSQLAGNSSVTLPLDQRDWAVETLRQSGHFNQQNE